MAIKKMARVSFAIYTQMCAYKKTLYKKYKKKKRKIKDKLFIQKKKTELIGSTFIHGSNDGSSTWKKN